MTLRARRGVAALATAFVLGLAGAATAAADTSKSSNWAGYAIHRSGVRFRQIVGSWTQPDATCTAGRASYSSVWVGIGGYALSSPALEQIGTELDCTSSGRAVSNAWYELVPAAARTTSLIVRPGDRMRASVSVTGHTVHLALSNLTRGRSFSRTVHPTLVDTTSAEWIVEAPSACTTASDCRTLPLANFGSAAISGARAAPSSGRHGSIADERWDASRISLAGGASPLGTAMQSRPILASPSALAAGGTAFTVHYSVGSDRAAAAAVRRGLSRRLVHPGR